MKTIRTHARAGVIAGVLSAALLTCGSIATAPNRVYDNYCAIMPDAVGLYVGNPVTQMGYQVGEVTGILPGLNVVRIEFKVDHGRALPSDVRAVTRSPSILTDRRLELVGNYSSGPRLESGACIPLSRSSTPKSLAEVIGSATEFINEINHAESTNLQGVVAGIDQSLNGNGGEINRLLTTSSSVLDAPDQAIADIRTIITSLGELTDMLRDSREPLKQAMLATYQTTEDIDIALNGGDMVFDGAVQLIPAVSDLEVHLGQEFQALFNDLGYALRKSSAHATILANLVKPLPVIVNWLANQLNDKQFFTMRYRPPLYRIATPVDGLVTCGAMNAASPGSCADVAGRPYAVDVALLQYVLTEAARR